MWPKIATMLRHFRTHAPRCDGVDYQRPKPCGDRSRYPACVTSRTRTRVRRSAVLTTAAGLFLLAAGPASAEVPDGWSDPPPVPVLEALLILAGIPLLLTALIGAAVYVPAMVRGERVAPGAEPVTDQWFGGPRGGARELESGAGRGEQAREAETGGAGGRW
jgi:hypothetical protein